jgi:hypothetical protein
MKNSILLITLVLGIWSCTNSPNESITLSVLADKTDSLIPQPKLSHITSFLQDVNYEQGTRNFYYQSVTDANVNTSFYATIPKADSFGNSLQHKAIVDKFYKQIDTLITTVNEEQTTYTSSSILKPLLVQLERVHKVNTSQKVVLLYSDLLEASDVFNVYRKRNQQLLIASPEKVVEIVQSQLDVPKLENMHLYIIYYPTDRLNNRLFEKMTFVYKALFKNSGLHIHIGIDNQIQL